MNDSFSIARYAAAHKYPYFARALFSLIPHEVKPGVMPSFAGCDDRWNLYIEPVGWGKRSLHEQTGVLIHEIGHLLQQHHKRTGQRSPELFNLAGDMEINDDFVGVVPDDAVFPNKPPFDFKEGLYAEEYYDLLAKKSKNPKHKSCGSCAHGHKESHEVPGEGHMTEAEKEMLIKKTAKDVLNHAKEKGNVPAGLKRWAESVSITYDPRKELASAIRNCVNWVKGRTDYTYSKPARRQYFFGNIIAPSMREPVPSVTVCIDTSGSMGEKDLGLALAVVDKTLKSMNQSCTVITGDTRAEFAKKITKTSAVDLLGGGGTDMGALIRKADEGKTDLIILVTDGYTDWPDKPRSKCVVALTQENKTPDWAKTVEIWRCVKE